MRLQVEMPKQDPYLKGSLVPNELKQMMPSVDSSQFVDPTPQFVTKVDQRERGVWVAPYPF